MDREGTLRLLAKGSHAWSCWAEELQSQRSNLEKSGRWATQPDGRGSNAETREWLSNATCDFSSREAPRAFDDLNLSGFTFPGLVNFECATFKGNALFARAQFQTFTNFQDAVFCGEADFDDTSFSGAHPSEITNFAGANRIPNARFSRNVDFSRACFRSRVGFRKAKFARTVWFNGTQFLDEAWFRQVRFAGDAPFWAAEFRGDAWFLEAHFDNEAWFESAIFMVCDANFTQAEFSGGATFSYAKFRGVAIFRAAQCRGAFSFEHTTFDQVPDFIQTHFSEAPQWDNVKIQPRRTSEEDLAPRFRALRRLAIQGHDYVREHEFFVGEFRAMRGRLDLPGPNFFNLLRTRSVDTTSRSSKIVWRWSRAAENEEREPLPIWPGGPTGTARFWLGLWYQGLSNFGRSLVLPIVWWLLITATFASLYLAVHVTLTGSPISRHDAFLSVLSAWSEHLDLPRLSGYLPKGLSAHFPHSIHPNFWDQCVIGSGDPFFAALGIAMRKALVLPGIDPIQKLNELYACLYGVYPLGNTTPNVLPAQFVPIIPESVALLGILQFLLSALLIFLFFLAMRNHFRIK